MSHTFDALTGRKAPTSAETFTYYASLDDAALVRVYRTTLERYRECRVRRDKAAEYRKLLLITDAARQTGRYRLLESPTNP